MSRIENKFITSNNAFAGQVLSADGAGNANWVSISGTPAYYAQAFFDSSSSWTTGNGFFSDPANSGGNTLTVRQSNGISLTAASSSLPGISFTPSSTSAVYSITANIGLLNTSPVGSSMLRLVDNSLTVISNSSGYEQQSSVPDVIVPLTISGIYVPGTTSPITVKVQIAAPTGSAATIQAANSIGISIEWTVIQLAVNSNPFDFFASNQVTTRSSANANTSFATFNNSPAFTFTPNFTGTYKVYSNCTYLTTAGNHLGNVRVFNTTGGATLLQESQAANYTGNASDTPVDTVFIQSIYTLTSGTPYVFDIQGQIDNASFSVELAGDQAPFYMFAERCG